MNSLTNQQIIERIQAIAEIKNFCDMTIELQKFDKEYKVTSFYKATKMSLKDLFQQYSIYKMLSLDGIFQKIQSGINHLDVSSLNSVLDAFTEASRKEYGDILNKANEVGLGEFFSKIKLPK